MPNLDYDDPEIEERWCNEQRTRVANYLRFEAVKHGRIGEWPAWHLAPYVSIWAIESLAHPGAVGWWVIAGDLPTDHCSSLEIESPQHPRKAMRVFADRWQKMAEAWKTGREYEGVEITGARSYQRLGPLLQSRAKLLSQWAENDACWDEE